MRFLIRLLQRLVILALGALSVWLIVFVFFELEDHRLPWVLALSLTYGVAAYVILPRVVRLGLKILQRNVCHALRRPATDCPVTPSISR